MKLIGLLGGMSWESSSIYYRIVNEVARKKLEGLHSANCVMYSFDFPYIAEPEAAGDLDELAKRCLMGVRALEKAGAELLVICCNSVHVIADQIERESRMPLLHIADCAGEAVHAQGLRKVGLLGTIYTMELPFYRKRLKDRFGLEVLVPDRAGREEVHRVIFEELCLGEARDGSRKRCQAIISQLAGEGAQGIILGCTELPLLLRQGDAELPLFDTTRLHAEKAALFALSDQLQ